MIPMVPNMMSKTKLLGLVQQHDDFFLSPILIDTSSEDFGMMNVDGGD